MVSIRKPKSALKFENPAAWWGSMWREALPAGNGVTGAAVYGGATNDTILINHADLSWQGHVSVIPDVADKLKEVRELLDTGKAKQAQDILSNAIISKNYRPQTAVPLPLCDFKVKMSVEKPVKDYMRVLNMENGEVSVTYKDGTTRYERSMFVSRDNDTIIYQINRSGNKTIDVEFSLDMHDRTNNRTPVSFTKLPDGFMTKYENFFIYFSARNETGTELGAVAMISYFGGSQEVSQNSIRIKGANNVLVKIKTFVESQREKEWKRLKTELAANKDNYDKMLKTHTSIHSKLLNSMELDLDADKRDYTVEALIRESQQGSVPNALIEKMWLYARYLMVCATADKGRPLNPYGLWCGDYKAVSAVLSADGLLQSMYQSVFAGNLSSLCMPVFNFYESVFDDLKKNAMRLYGARGIFVPSINSPGTGMPGSAEPNVIHFTGCAGWIALMFYNYACYNDDIKFLKTRALPFMKEAALFYEDFFKLGDDGYYVSSPGYSPNTNPSNYVESDENEKLMIAQNATVDFAISKELLSCLIEGSTVAGMNKNEIPKWQEMLTKIPPYQTNNEGLIKEYMSNQFADNYASRHISHLFGAAFGNDINSIQTDNDTIRAFINSGKRRLYMGNKEHTSWSLGNLATMFARLGDADSALECLTAIVRATLMNNMITAENDWRGMGIGCDNNWAPYQMQGNQLFASAVQEMLVTSTTNAIKLLPSHLADWNKIDVKGMQTRCGVEVGLSYNGKTNTLIATLKAKKASKIDLYFPAGTKRVAKGLNSDSFNAEQLNIKGIELPAGKAVSFDIKYTPSAKKF